ncbi:MAG: hypothetical protein ABW098_00500 [Candidatus Thiodiazotropha sp.]
MDINNNTYISIIVLISFLLASCAPDSQQSNEILGFLYVSEKTFNERSNEFILNKQDIENVIEENGEKYYRIDFTSKFANAWWSSWELPETVENNILKYKSSKDGNHDAEVGKLLDSFRSLDRLMRSKYIKDERLYKLINEYCHSTNSVIQANSPFPSVNFVMSMGHEYRFLARVFYERLERPDGARFASCNV